eukprot:1218024-Pyramimonas_sp.AAC.1
MKQGLPATKIRDCLTLLAKTLNVRSLVKSGGCAIIGSVGRPSVAPSKVPISTSASIICTWCRPTTAPEQIKH